MRSGDAVQEADHCGTADIFVWHPHGRQGGQTIGGLDPVIARHGTVFRHPNPPLLEILDQLITLVIRRTNPRGDAITAYLFDDLIRYCARRKTRGKGMNIERTIREELQTLRVKPFHEGPKPAGLPLAVD